MAGGALNRAREPVVVAGSVLKYYVEDRFFLSKVLLCIEDLMSLAG